MAIAGLSPDPYGRRLNQVYLDLPVNMGSKGPIYPINPKGGCIGSLQACPSIKDAVCPVDSIVSCIPAHLPG